MMGWQEITCKWRIDNYWQVMDDWQVQIVTWWRIDKNDSVTEGLWSITPWWRVAEYWFSDRELKSSGSVTESWSAVAQWQKVEQYWLSKRNCFCLLKTFSSFYCNLIHQLGKVKLVNLFVVIKLVTNHSNLR